MVRKSLNTHGTLLVYLLCRLLTVGCFQKNRFGEIVNSGSQNNSKVQSTLSQIISLKRFELMKRLENSNSLDNCKCVVSGPLGQPDAPSNWYSRCHRTDPRSGHLSFVEIRS